jgi:hypothetical protein
MRLTLRALLAEGYFPPELPPPFTTKSFAAALARPGRISLPEGLTQSRNEWCDLAQSPISGWRNLLWRTKRRSSKKPVRQSYHSQKSLLTEQDFVVQRAWKMFHISGQWLELENTSY